MGWLGCVYGFGSLFLLTMRMANVGLPLGGQLFWGSISYRSSLFIALILSWLWILRLLSILRKSQMGFHFGAFVRSFGTEGRKKDGPQIPANDKVYEFIIFRGTDIKDLQVKMSPPPPIHNDPAIISLQAQDSQPPSAPPPYVPPLGSLTGHHSTYKASPAPYYQSASTGVPLWAPPPPPQVPSGNMPLYWQGFYGPPDQHQLMEPPSVSMPAPAPTVSQAISVSLTPETQSTLAPFGQEQISSPPVAGSTFTLSPPSHSLVTPDLSRHDGSTGVPAVEPVHPSRWGSRASLPITSSQPSSLSSPNVVSSGLQHEGTVANVQQSKRDEVKLQPRYDFHSVDPSGVSSLSMSSPAPLTVQRGSLVTSKSPMVYKQVNKQIQVSKDHLHSGQRIFAPKVQSPSRPLLPLPNSPTQHRPPLQFFEEISRNAPRRRGGSRGGGMRRASRGVQSGSKLLEDFDYIAMNENFNKKEVWDELLKVESKDRVSEETDATQGLDYGVESKESERTFDGPPSELSRRSVYVKDDFFDSLSCDSLGREHGKQDRVKFSEQRKIDAETFGSSQIRSYRGGGGHRGRHRGTRGGRRSVGRGQGHAFGYHNVSLGDGRAGAAG